MTRRLFTWQFFIGVIIGGFICFILGAVLATFFYMKNIDFGNIHRDQEHLMEEVKELTKERQQINYIFKERGLIRDWNKQAVVEPGEEEKWIKKQ